MTQEKKQLLLQDLCGRLPYGVFMTNKKLRKTFYPLTCDDLKDAMFDDDWDDIPYLRPMSSMTEEEMDKIEEILGDKCIFDFMGNGDVSLHQGNFTQNTLSKLHDFYNSIHVDYRGLIEKGLAIAVTKEHNPYQN